MVHYLVDLLVKVDDKRIKEKENKARRIRTSG